MKKLRFCAGVPTPISTPRRVWPLLRLTLVNGNAIGDGTEQAANAEVVADSTVRKRNPRCDMS